MYSFWYHTPRSNRVAMGGYRSGLRVRTSEKRHKKTGQRITYAPDKKKTKKVSNKIIKWVLHVKFFFTILPTKNNKKYVIWYHRPKSNPVAMRVTGRGCRFESHNPPGTHSSRTRQKITPCSPRSRLTHSSSSSCLLPFFRSLARVPPTISYSEESFPKSPFTTDRDRTI